MPPSYCVLVNRPLESVYVPLEKWHLIQLVAAMDPVEPSLDQALPER